MRATYHKGSQQSPCANALGANSNLEALQTTRLKGILILVGEISSQPLLAVPSPDIDVYQQLGPSVENPVCIHIYI